MIATAELACERTMTLPDGTILESHWALRRISPDGRPRRLPSIELLEDQDRLHAEADAALARAGWHRTGDWTPTPVDGYDDDYPQLAPTLTAPIARGEDLPADTIDYATLAGWTPGPGGLTAHRDLEDGSRLNLIGPIDRTGYILEGTDREGKTFKRFIRGSAATLRKAEQLAGFLPMAAEIRASVRAHVQGLLEKDRRRADR